MVNCCVPTCGNSTRNFKLHVLPKDKDIRIKWCIAIHREDLIDIDAQTRNRYRVCEVHFEENEKIGGPSNRKHLKYTACPTLKLPGLMKQAYILIILSGFLLIFFYIFGQHFDSVNGSTVQLNVGKAL